MSDERHDTEANAEVQEKQNVSENESMNVEDVLKRVEMLERTNQRLLEESKGYADKYRGLRDGVEKEKKQKLEQEENWKELLDIEKNKNHELNEVLMSTRKQVLQERLHTEVAKHARDAHNIDLVIKALPRDMVSIDEETLEIKGVSDAINLLKEKEFYLFDQKKNSGQPNSRPSAVNGKVAYSELSQQEKDELFRKALEGGYTSS